jgi:hypothetical protein
LDDLRTNPQLFEGTHRDNLRSSTAGIAKRLGSIMKPLSWLALNGSENELRLYNVQCFVISFQFVK